MNKKLVIFVVLLAAMLLSAVGAWPATLTVNNYTGDNVYIKLSKYGVMKYFLTATVEGNSADRNISKFDIERNTYAGEVTACGVTTTWANFNLKTNLRLTFTDCAMMKQFDLLEYNVCVDEEGEDVDCFLEDGITPNPEVDKTYKLHKKVLTPKYWGEPSIEKVNFYSSDSNEYSPPDQGWFGGLYEKDGNLGLNKYINRDAFHFLYDVVP